MKRRALPLISLILAAALLLSCPAFSAGTQRSRADALFSLGLFQGTDAGYELEAGATRIQGLIMLLRLLGVEDEALVCDAPMPFADVPDWASGYAAYAWKMGYTDGTGPCTFDPNGALDAKSYVTLLLRALGYNDFQGDFDWSTALDDSVDFGLMTQSSAAALPGVPFIRGLLAELSYCALTMPLKGQRGTLAERLTDEGVFTREQGKAAGVMDGRIVYEYAAPDTRGEAVQYQRRSISTSSGAVAVDVITLDLSVPGVRVRAAAANGALGGTQSLSDIISRSGANAVINANFMNPVQLGGASCIMPVGHLMSGGRFLHGVSGVTSFGFTESGEVRVGKPALFFRVNGEGGKSWPCYELNSQSQSEDASVLYTPAFPGGAVPVTLGGIAVTVSGGRVSDYRACAVGDTLSIPSDGYVMWLSKGYTSTPYFSAPAAGDAVTGFTPYLFREDSEGFDLAGVTDIVSGAPRLVKDGRPVTELEYGFTGERFTVQAATRTAIGTLSDTKIVLVSADAATIQQMREIMLALGCVDAANLDGGASSAMYCGGRYIRSPGRELAFTLQVFTS